MGYITLAFLGIPNKGKHNQKWLPPRCLLGGPKEGKNATSPLYSRGSPTPSAGSSIRSGPQQKGNIISGCHILALSGAKKEGGWATSPLHSWGSPTKGNTIRSGCLTRALSRAQKGAKMLYHPCILGGPQHQARGAASQVVPNEGEQNQKWLQHPCLLGGRKEGGWATSPLHSWGSPTKGNKIRGGCLTRAFSGAQNRAKMLHHPCILRGPQRQARGAKSEVVPNKKEQNQKWLPHPCLVRGQKRGWMGYATLAFLGTPDKREQNQKWSPTKEEKIRSGCNILAFSGAGNRVDGLCHPCILGDPQQKGSQSEVAAFSRAPQRQAQTTPK